MFAAAMLYAAPNTEISIYSTCKRISQKLLRNVIKFLDLIYQGLNVPRYPVLRENMEELVIRGPESSQDVRVVNSYPSKVTITAAPRDHCYYYYYDEDHHHVIRFYYHYGHKGPADG